MAIRNNLILNADSHKPSHWLQFPPDVTASTTVMKTHGYSASNVGFGMGAPSTAAGAASRGSRPSCEAAGW